MGNPVVADIQRAAWPDIQAGLLLHLTHQGPGKGLAYGQGDAYQHRRPLLW